MQSFRFCFSSVENLARYLVIEAEKMNNQIELFIGSQIQWFNFKFYFWYSELTPKRKELFLTEFAVWTSLLTFLCLSILLCEFIKIESLAKSFEIINESRSQQIILTVSPFREKVIRLFSCHLEKTQMLQKARRPNINRIIRFKYAKWQYQSSSRRHEAAFELENAAA